MSGSVHADGTPAVLLRGARFKSPRRERRAGGDAGSVTGHWEPEQRDPGSVRHTLS